MSDLLPVKLPEFNRPVKAVIASQKLTHVVTAFLIAVDEDDCEWRFVDDNSELNVRSFDVVYWVYKDQLQG